MPVITTGLLGLAAAPAATVGVVAAESATNGFDPWSLLTTGGPVGILVAVFYLLLTGRLHTDADYQRVVADLDTERAARLSLQTTLTGEVVPAVTRSTDATTRSTDLMEALARRQAGGD